MFLLKNSFYYELLIMVVKNPSCLVDRTATVVGQVVVTMTSELEVVDSIYSVSFFF